MAQMSNLEHLGAFSIKQFCEWAGIGRSKVYALLATKQLSAKKIGRRTVITREAAECWLRSLPERT
jgi:excisionase family DNA binding protein